MKTFLKISLTVVSLSGLACLAGLISAQAQETNRGPHALTVNPELAAQISTAEQQPTIQQTNLPYGGRGLTYISAQFAYWPPLPVDVFGLPVWDLGGGVYLIDDLSVDYAVLDTNTVQTSSTMTLMARPMGGGGPLDLSSGGYPYLTISPTGTNQLLITVYNTNTATYYLQMTPVLDSADYPYSIIANGTNGQTNFTVNIGPYADEFFRALMASNNPGAGIAVFIDSPANGATVQ